jgi:GxxExxY protein
MIPDSSPFKAATRRTGLVEEQLSYTINGAFFDVYNELGYGYVESVYSAAMVVALQQRGLTVEREVPVAVVFRGVEVGRHRLDLLVERRVILEIKSTEVLAEHAKRQLRSYLKASDLELGIILHFGPRAGRYRVLGKQKAESGSSDSA